MEVKLDNRFLILCSVSLLTFLPACGGQQTSTGNGEPPSPTEDPSTVKSIDHSDNGEKPDANSLDNQLNTSFDTFYGQITSSLTTLDEEKTIEYQGFQEANKSLNTIKILIEKNINEEGLNESKKQDLAKINSLIQEITYILENFGADGTTGNQKIQEKLNLTTRDGEIPAGGPTSQIMKDYLHQRTERIATLVKLITVSNSSSDEDESVANGTKGGNKGSNAQEGEQGGEQNENGQFLNQVKYPLLVILVGFLAFLAWKYRKKLRKILSNKETQRNRGNNEADTSSQGDETDREKIAQILQELDQAKDNPSELEKFLTGLKEERIGSQQKIDFLLAIIKHEIDNQQPPKSESETTPERVSETSDQSAHPDSFQTQLLSPINTSLAPLHDIANVLTNPNLANFLNDALPKILDALPEMKGYLHKLEKLDQLDQLNNLPQLIRQVSTLTTTINEPLQYLQEIPKITSAIQPTKFPIIDPATAPSLNLEELGIGGQTQEVIPNVINFHSDKNPSQTISEIEPDKLEETEPEPKVIIEPPTPSVRYNEILSPENLLNKYHNHPNDIEERSEKIKQSLRQIQDQSGGSTELIFELAEVKKEGENSDNTSCPYWKYPCSERNPEQPNQPLYWLFLDPNLQITESNYQILARFFKGPITMSWRNRLWELKEPALLVEISENPGLWKLVKQGRLKLDI